MRLAMIVATIGAGILTTACRNTSPRAAATTAANAASAEGSIFTDSATHVRKCERNRPGEDWRKVCVPKDQALDVRRKP